VAAGVAGAVAAVGGSPSESVRRCRSAIIIDVIIYYSRMEPTIF
jgi:hypothetical protein